MRMITLAGAHACGKTSVILKTSDILKKSGLSIGVIKLDCIMTHDDKLYTKSGIPCVKYLAGNICPDHFFADNAEDFFQWGIDNNLDILITESAGLCGRCSPHIRTVPAVCVIDCLSGITAPLKAGPMLKYADVIAVTKGDLVSPAEREVFLHNIRIANKKARIIFINGLSGQGAYRLADFIYSSDETENIHEKFLRFTMPAAVCTFCSGQMKIGKSLGVGGRIKWMQ